MPNTLGRSSHDWWHFRLCKTQSLTCILRQINQSPRSQWNAGIASKASSLLKSAVDFGFITTLIKSYSCKYRSPPRRKQVASVGVCGAWWPFSINLFSRAGSLVRQCSNSFRERLEVAFITGSFCSACKVQPTTSSVWLPSYLSRMLLWAKNHLSETSQDVPSHHNDVTSSEWSDLNAW